MRAYGLCRRPIYISCDLALREGLLEKGTNRLQEIQTLNSGSLLARVMRALWSPYTSVELIHVLSKKSLEVVFANWVLLRFSM